MSDQTTKTLRGSELGVSTGSVYEGWAKETMRQINELTKEITMKGFDPDWFLLSERLKEAERVMTQNSPDQQSGQANTGGVL